MRIWVTGTFPFLITITAYVYPPDASLEEDFTTCQHILSTSILSQQNLVEQGPLKLDHWPKTQQATYRCSGLTAYAKYTQLVMFELPKSTVSNCASAATRTLGLSAKLF